MQQRHLEEVRENILGDFSKRFPRPGEQNNLLLTTEYNSQNSKTSVGTLLNQQLSDAAEYKKSANPFIAADPTANALHSHINDDLTAKALGLPYYNVKPQTNSIRPAPTAQSVQAEWDPFGANRMKPKF